MGTSQADSPKFDCWGILELMGHRRVAGRITEETVGGAGMLRVDIPEVVGAPHDPEVIQGFTQFYNPTSVYCFTPTSEAVARHIARAIRTRPIAYYDLPAGLSRALPSGADEEEGGEDDVEADR